MQLRTHVSAAALAAGLATAAQPAGAWTLEELSAFLTKPSAYAPGTNMVYNGLRKPEDRVNVIAYLNEADGTPEPLVPAGAAADAGAGEGDVPADGDAPAEGEAPAEGDGTTNE